MEIVLHCRHCGEVTLVLEDGDVVSPCCHVVGVHIDHGMFDEDPSWVIDGEKLRFLTPLGLRVQDSSLLYGDVEEHFARRWNWPDTFVWTTLGAVSEVNYPPWRCPHQSS